VNVEPEFSSLSMEPPGGSRERIGSNAPLTRRRKSDKQVTKGVVGSTDEMTSRSSSPKSGQRVSGPDGVSQTIHSGRICFPGLFTGHKETEGHDRYECKLLCEQRRNLHKASDRG